MSTFWIVVILKSFMISVCCLTPDEIQIRMTGWNVDPETQYHIQTDEGPERYFRFQTLNGQFRKEKRLHDGTVVGTDGWLDPLGYLRIKDYVADRDGFRILRSKTVFVGRDRAINDAIAVSKRIPASDGFAVRARRPPNPFRTQKIQELSSNSIEGNRAIEPHHSYGALSSTKKFPRYYSTTILPILMNEINNDVLKPRRNYDSKSYQMEIPYICYENSNFQSDPPQTDDKSSFPRIAAVTISSKSISNAHRHVNDLLMTPGHFDNSAKQNPKPLAYHSIERYDNTKESNHHSRYNINGNYRKSQTSYINPPTENDEQFPKYNGAHTLSDGFQYYLKTHYHEEEQKCNKSIGSYGYVDPFGIRRVIYYKADRENGFVHKNNNRYVGFDATPYDPVLFKSN